MKKALATVALVALSMSANALLVDVPGANYSYDASTNLRWLDVVAATSLSYDQLSGSSLYAQGWRLATGEQLSDLYASNLTELATAPAQLDVGIPFYGGRLTDFYAPQQSDPTQSVYRLVTLLGGQTLNYSPVDPMKSWIGIAGIVDREVASGDGGGAHAMSLITFGRDGTGSVSIAGGSADDYASTRFGLFLVQSQQAVIPPNVPEPSTWLMMAAGMFSLVLIGRRRQGGWVGQV